MKILWLGGVILPCIAAAEKQNPVYVNGWLIKTADMIAAMPENKLIYVFENHKEVSGVVNGIQYYGVESNHSGSKSNLSELIGKFQSIILEEKPDIIHIWGTEDIRSLALVEASERTKVIDRVVVSIQGLVSKYAIHFTGYLPTNIVNSYTVRDLIKGNISKSQKKFIKNGEAENQVLSRVKHVIGRTDWDRACVWDVNPKAIYHFNNETLRDEFYSSCWQYDKCEKYSIFCSQGHYPIKGIHLVIEALRRVVQEFPDAHLYVAGKDYFDTPWYKMPTYGKYIVNLVNEYGLRDNVTFTGFLNASEMKSHFLQSNVFVSASSIENSPNSLGEGMILGVPCISSRVGGVHNLLSHGLEGYLYPADEYYMLSYYICELFRNPEMATEFGKNARIHAMDTHDPEKNFSSLLDIYSSISK